jgi:hypothetical protein
MPNLNPINVTLSVAQQVTLHENPEDISGNPAVPLTSYVWAVTPPAMGSITPSGVDAQDALFVPAGTTGAAAVTATIVGPYGTEQSNYAITVTAAPFDHSAPSADPPVVK